MSASLNTLVRTVAAEHPEVPSNKLAQLVAEATDPADLPEFYIAALQPLVSDMIRLNRNAALNSPKGRSPKREDRASWWQQVLGERVYVGEARWKTLGDCTFDDLQFCIGERQDQIAALQGQIVKYEVIAAAMQQHAAEKVADLPEGAVEL